MKTIAVFGGAGFVGTHLTKLLTNSGPRYRLLVADKREPETPLCGTVDYVACDVRKPIDGTGLRGEVAAVVNLAAVHKSPGHPSHEYFETNIAGARNVCAFAEHVGCDRIVFTSSISVYGPGEDEKTEESIPMPNIPYGISKIVAEHIHREWMLHGTDRKLTIIRPAVIFGRGEKNNFTRIATALRTGVFVYPGRTDTIKSCCYVKDVCRFIESELHSDRRFGLYNFCYPEKITIKDVCRAFHKAVGYRLPRMVVPQSVMNRLASGMKAFRAIPAIGRLGIDPRRIAKLVNSTNISSRKMARLTGFAFQYDLTAALQDWAKDCGGDKLY